MNRVVCKRAKSDMTPCYVTDGDLVTAIAITVTGLDSRKQRICVGCVHDIELLREEREAYQHATVNAMKNHGVPNVQQPLLPWRPIAELDMESRYGDEAGFLLLAPELVDLDCNVHGVGMGHYQDDRDMPHDENGACGEEGVDYGGWLACKWSMTNDEWRHVPCTPTHYLRLTGLK